MATENYNYSLDPEIGESQSYMNTAGIHDNCKLVNIEFEELGGKAVGKQLIFTFIDSLGATFRHVEFERRFSEDFAMAKKWNPRKSEDENREIAKGMHRSQQQRIYHILICFLAKDQIKIEGGSWDKFCTGLMKLVGKTYEGVLLRMKLVYNNKDRVNFPAYVKGSGFLQPMDSDIQLAIDPKDNMVKSTPLPSTIQEDDEELYGIQDGREESAVEEEVDDRVEESGPLPGHVTGENDAPFEDVPVTKPKPAPQKARVLTRDEPVPKAAPVAEHTVEEAVEEEAVEVSDEDMAFLND